MFIVNLFYFVVMASLFPVLPCDSFIPSCHALHLVHVLNSHWFLYHQFNFSLLELSNQPITWQFLQCI